MPDSPYPSFLATVAQALCRRHADQIGQLTLVVPNQATGQALQQCLAAQMTRPTWSPQIWTWPSLIEQLSQLQIAPTWALVIELYQALQALQPDQTSLERFYGWGTVLVQDLDALDQYRVPVQQLFANLRDQKTIEQSYAYLTEGQRAAIASFWKHFGKRLSKQQQDFLQFWELLPQLYTGFKQRLVAQGMAYEGLCYNRLLGRLPQSLQPLRQHHRLVCVGFHALSTAAEQCLAAFQNQVPTELYWDVDAYYMEDERQEAGRYLRTYQQQPHFQQSFSTPFPQHIRQNPKQIHLFAVSSRVGQVQVVKEQLQALKTAQGGGFSPAQTGIVLADTTLFLPMLYALPPDVHPTHTTLGYPVPYTQTYALLQDALTLQMTLSQEGRPAGYFPIRNVQALLGYPHMHYLPSACVQQVRQYVATTPDAYIQLNQLLAESTCHRVVFTPLRAPGDTLQYVLDVLHQLTPYCTGSAPSPSVEKRAWNVLYDQLTQLQQRAHALPISSIADFASFLHQLVAPMEIQLDEGTASGVSLLRVWETGQLDFDNVFIVGMNEGVFPAKAGGHSLIPYNLRKGYGLPTGHDWQSSLDAYYFYRLLQRSRRVYITYSTQAVETGPSEMSRYLWQLLYESQLPIEQNTVTPRLQVPTRQDIIIPKTEQVMRRLNRFLVSEQPTPRSLTPSAINTYLSCSLRFYFQYIAGLQQPVETTQEMQMGHAFHRVMERLYTPLMRSQLQRAVQARDIAALEPHVASVVEASVTYPLFGQHTPMIQAMLTKLAQRMLALDEAYAPFDILGLELGRNDAAMRVDFELSAGRYIRLSGIIDRADRKPGSIRILDYKTGTHEKRIASIDALFGREASLRNPAALQVLFYAWLFAQRYATENTAIVPGIIHTRASFATDFDTQLLIQRAQGSGHRPLGDIKPYQAAFSAGLRGVLEELLDPSIPFVQTGEIDACTRCPYRGICERH